MAESEAAITDLQSQAKYSECRLDGESAAAAGERFSCGAISDARTRFNLIDDRRADPWVPEDLLPNRHEQGMELLNSVGLRVGGEVVGWVITHQIVRNVYRYTCSFVKTELQRRLAIVPLYREAISRQVQKEGQDTIGIWTVPVRHHQMVAFVEHRMAPHLHSLDYSLAATKRYTQ